MCARKIREKKDVFLLADMPLPIVQVFCCAAGLCVDEVLSAKCVTYCIETNETTIYRLALNRPNKNILHRFSNFI